MSHFALRLVIALAFAFVATAAWASCPSSYADGCSGAPAPNADTVQQPNFFSYARQSGQTYASTPQWNVAGVDYAVGVNAAYAGNLLDPATAPLPAGCGFHGGALPYVSCASVNNLTISGYDFGHSIAGSVQLYIAQGVTGTLTISNNKFFNGPTVDRQFFDVLINPGDNNIPNTANVVMNYNYFDGNGIKVPNGLNASLVADFSTGSLTFQYNAMVNIPGRVLYYGTGSNVNISYNYGEGLNYNSPFHSDFFAGFTSANEEFGFNTLLTDSNNFGATAHIYLSDGVSGGTVLLANVDHNVLVSNLNGSNLASNFSNLTSSYLIEAAYQNFDTINYEDNFFDPTGSFGPIAPYGVGGMTATTITSDGNVDMLNGLPVIAGSSSDVGQPGVPEPSTFVMVLIACAVFAYPLTRRADKDLATASLIP